MEVLVAAHAFQPVLQGIHGGKFRDERDAADEREFDDLPNVAVAGHERLALVEGGGRLALHAALCRLIAALGDLTVRDGGAFRCFVCGLGRGFGHGVLSEFLFRLHGGVFGRFVHISSPENCNIYIFGQNGADVKQM